MIDYKDDVFAAEGDPNSEELKERVPGVSNLAREFIADNDDLIAELSDISELFRMPATNNIPFFEDGDPNKPVYHIGDFCELVKEAFLRHGWTPPENNNR